MNRSPLKDIWVLATALLLAACGGGGGSSQPSVREALPRLVQDVNPAGARLDFRSRNYFPAGAGAGFGFINGGMTGTGVVLISLLMAGGVQSAGLIATDAIISAIMGLFKVAIFGGLARLDASLAIAGLLIGLCTIPGAFVARRLLNLIPARIHTAVMEAVVVIGGVGFLWRGWA